MFIAPKAPDILPGSTEGQWEIDWDHPINQGCVFRVLFDEVNAPYDLVTGVKGVPSNGPTRSVAGQMPAAALASASSQYYRFAHHPSWNLLGDKTLIWQGLIASGSAYRHLFGKSGATNDSTTTPWSFWCDTTATPTAAFISSNANYKLFYGGPNVSLNEWHTVAVRASDLIETTPSFYVDGVLSSPGSVSGTGTGAPTSNTNDIWVGRRPDGGVQMNGRVAQAAAFSRQLSLDELHAFYANPYIGLRRPSPWLAAALDVSISLDGAAGSAATTDQAGDVAAGAAAEGDVGSGAVSGGSGGIGAGASLDGGAGSAAATGGPGGVSVDGSSLVRVTPITGARRRAIVGEGVAPIIGWARKPIILEAP